MALNEIQGGGVGNYKVKGANNGFTAEVCINSQTFEGFGHSKTAAKNNASEKALRELIISKMSKKSRKSISVNGKSTAGTEDKEGDIEMGNAENSTNDEEDEEDVPMLNLASFALHKLFTEWESQGFKIPDFRNYNGGSLNFSDDNSMTETDKIENKKVPKIRTELPPNPENFHPCMLLTLVSIFFFKFIIDKRI